jgi:23S rRNA (cytosine1962-C5)-methyltransferase
MDDRYELIDAGNGRRLERFGAMRLDRPAPAAAEARRAPGLWAGAVTYRAGRGWATADGTSAPDGAWPVRLAGVTLFASLATGGQVGVFPEHARNASWVRSAIDRRLGHGAESPTLLNLFAYTGLLTLEAAAAGAAVTHLDASRPAVQWARRNAAANGLDDRPIRWIVDDAAAYLRREARRGRRYDGLILDPPSYGHGGDRTVAGAFRFERDIAELLEAATAVARPDAFWLLSTHTAGWDSDRLGATLATALDVRPTAITAMPLELEATSGARLALGAAARLDPLAGKPR